MDNQNTVSNNHPAQFTTNQSVQATLAGTSTPFVDVRSNESCLTEQQSTCDGTAASAADTSTGERSLEDIAADIIKSRETEATSFIEIGNLLIEAQKQLEEKRTWLKWLSDNVEFSSRAADRYMRVARAFSDSPALAKLGLTKLDLLLSLPDDERESFIKTKHKIGEAEKFVYEMSWRELNKAVRERKKDIENEDKAPIYKPIRNFTQKNYTSCIEQTEKEADTLLRYIRLHADNAGILEKADRIYSLKKIIEECAQIIEAHSQAIKEDSKHVVSES